jgi:hypothetical protein
MWATIINILLGLWLMFSPGLLQFEKVASDNNYIVGPLVLTFAIIALWELNRSVRFLNIITGVWLIVSPFMLGFQSSITIWIIILSGALITGFSFVKRKIKRNYGGGWSSLFEKDPAHLRQK